MIGRRRHLALLTWVIVGGLALILPQHAFAAAVGQIKGQITDETTGEPIIGASVLVVGTNRGAMTDVDGRYTIGQLDPGTYTLRVSSIGYNTFEVQEILVKSDLTTEQDVAISPTEAQLEKTITVTADRDIIDKFEVSNQQVITKETIERQPVQTVDKLLSQVAGVQSNNEGEIFIRGGRAGEVAYIVDGVPIGDPLGGLGDAGANLSLVSGSIQEFTVIKDGFDPEYGNALSGIIKVNTAQGSNDFTNVNAQFITDDFGNDDLNEYSRNNDYVRFSVSGPDPLLKSKILPAIGINWLKDKEFTYYFYAEVDKSNGFYQYERYDTPLTQRPYDNLSLAGFNVPERLENRYYYQANFRLRPKQNLRFVLSYKNREVDRTLFSWAYRYSAATAPVRIDKWQSLSLEVSQVIGRNLNYEAIFSWSETSVNQKPGDPTSPGHGLNPDQFTLQEDYETYDDRNGNGVYDAPEPIINLFPDTASYGVDFTGPAYTYGEFIDVDGDGRYNPNAGDRLLTLQNIQSGGTDQIPFRFNDNGILDVTEGEPFIDINGNGVWDEGDFLRDKNGNGILDNERNQVVRTPEPEPFIDGDSIIGEPFIDFNGDGVFTPGIDVFRKTVGADNMDLNYNGQHDGPNDPWEPGIPFIDRNGNGLYDPPNSQYDPGEPFTDVNGNNQYDAGGTNQFLNPGTFASDGTTWHFRRSRTLRGEVKLFWQLGNHELKAGGAFDKNDFRFEEIEDPFLRYTGRPDGGPYPDRGSFRDIWQYDPWSGQVYFRDKIEYGSMIASLGLRMDFFLQDKNDLVDIARNDDLGSGVILGDRHKLSPRIGFSYPISDKAKVHFNYGHFYQLPSFTRMYRRNTTNVDANTIIGNYNLDYEKTIQYSFGVKYAMSENYSVDISGYFKDEFDKINSQSLFVSGLTRQQYRNVDYGRSRGIELQLERRGGGYVNGLLTYTYAFAFGKASQAAENYQSDFELSREPLSEAPLDNDIRHRFTASVQVFVPNTVKPRLFGMPIPNGWSVSILSVIESGEPFTPSETFPGIETRAGEDIQRNSLRKAATVNFDIRATKEFSIARQNFNFILWVENVFDNRNVDIVYPETGRADTQQNFSGEVRAGTEFDQDPSNWDFGRQVRVGLEWTL